MAAAKFDVVVTDLQMPGMNGLEFICEIERRRLDVQVLMITAHASVASAVEAMRLGRSITSRNHSMLSLWSSRLHRLAIAVVATGDGRT